jgi:hypothetical protein
MDCRVKPGNDDKAEALQASLAGWFPLMGPFYDSDRLALDDGNRAAQAVQTFARG